MIDVERLDPLGGTVGLEVANAMTQSAANMTGEWIAEMARFVGHRMATDAELVKALSTCADPGDAAIVIARFVDDARGDYAALAKDVRERSIGAPSECLKCAEDQFGPSGPLPIE